LLSFFSSLSSLSYFSASLSEISEGSLSQR
jgi:hypothetical protein